MLCRAGGSRCPQSIEFAFTGERFDVRLAARRAARDCDARRDRLTVQAPDDDQAREALAAAGSSVRPTSGWRRALLQLAQDLNYSVERVVIRCQRTRWGSCSTRGTVSLNCSLVFLRPEVVRYLFVHELAHTKHMNHSAGFWRLVQTLEPDYRRLDRELLAGWRTVPVVGLQD